jgi:tRNA (guanosine-2'-O-)-methyltransferase
MSLFFMKRFVPEFRTERRKEKLRAVLEKRQPDITIVLENVHDPHNVSAVIRSCDAVGLLDVNFIYYGGQEFPKLIEKSSASARKWINVKKFDSVEECYNNLRTENKKIYTTNMAIDSMSLYDLDLTQPVALVFGNEHKGVSKEATEAADGNFLIPQTGVIQSLNISVATAVSLFEAYRQREKAGFYTKRQINDTKFEQILKEWLSK